MPIQNPASAASLQVKTTRSLHRTRMQAMFGAHLSIAAGLHNALLSAEKFGMDTVQIFTKNQMQWDCRPLEAAAIELWKQHIRRLKFKKTVSHASYLINLAATN